MTRPLPVAYRPFAQLVRDRHGAVTPYRLGYAVGAGTLDPLPPLPWYSEKGCRLYMQGVAIATLSRLQNIEDICGHE